MTTGALGLAAWCSFLVAVLHWHATTGTPPLPAPVVGVWLVAGIYTARGLAAVPQMTGLLRGRTDTAPRDVVFSLVSLAIGVLHLVGLTSA